MESILGLEGRVCFVTGSTRGIGWATARELARQGATVILNSRCNPELLAQRRDELREEFATEVGSCLGDVGDSEAMKDCYASIFKNYRRLDILVNNAGILDDRILGMISSQHIEQVFRVNVQGIIVNMQYAARLMARNNTGSIVNISSIIGRFGNAGQVVYGGSKAAVIGMTLSAAKELAVSNIRVNAIAPGFIDTDMIKALPPGKHRERLQSIKMGRIGTPEDVACGVLFFCSDLSAYVTGQVLGVDGGMLI
ncbi:SDR family NAD(P)-dependent oxidoreductase [Geomonas anaerohicana]|uniref:Glucose 1-dehydrogenase n=1 Tax=Geomonas anaerohicana TaxID=2798583 RepID=A0ABS0YC48_9BACT|nr:glucose 1-dehydrogenase [Geomonas anaerohicana]MBJ6749865.1 glucose 1-dehydrogenase [Geomonas anaerohicana]